MQRRWGQVVAGMFMGALFPLGPSAQAQSQVQGNDVSSEPPPDLTVASPAVLPAFLVPLRFEASYSIAAADFEVPLWESRSGGVDGRQNSTEGYMTENRFTALVWTRLGRLQSVRYGLSFNRGSSGAPGLASTSENVPSLLRFWGMGGDVSLVRHVSSWLDVDFGMQADFLSWGVTEIRQSQAAQDAALDGGPPSRLNLQSGYRVGWQAGLGASLAGPVGVLFRLGGLLTKMKFATHPKPLETQGLVASLGVSLDLGRGEP